MNFFQISTEFLGLSEYLPPQLAKIWDHDTLKNCCSLSYLLCYWPATLIFFWTFSSTSSKWRLDLSSLRNSCGICLHKHRISRLPAYKGNFSKKILNVIHFPCILYLFLYHENIQQSRNCGSYIKKIRHRRPRNIRNYLALLRKPLRITTSFIGNKACNRVN